MLMRNHFLRNAVEMVFGRRIVAQPEALANPRVPHGSRGATPIVRSCYVCQDQKKKQRKTIKNCVDCVKPVCDEHSVSKTACTYL